VVAVAAAGAAWGLVAAAVTAGVLTLVVVATLGIRRRETSPAVTA